MSTAELSYLAEADAIMENGDFANPAMVSAPLRLAFGGMLPAGQGTARRAAYRFRQPAYGAAMARPAPEWRPW
jgi:hypothetical protein